MVDTTQPAMASEFEACGVDSATAHSLAAQANVMAGRSGSGDRNAMGLTLTNIPPPARTPAAVTTTPTQAMEAVHAHTNAQLQAEMDATFAPPAAPTDYRFPVVDENPTPEQMAQDTELKTQFYREGMPQMVVESIAKSLASASRTLANETPAQRELRTVATGKSLTRMWGDQMTANLQAVDTILDGMRSRSPALGKFYESTAHLLGPLDLDLLLQVAKQRTRQRS